MSANPMLEFLLARIAEDEAQLIVHRVGCHFIDNDTYGECDCGGEARLAAECAAKRAIVELHSHDDEECWEMHRGVYGPGWPEGAYAVEGESWAHPSLEPIEVRQDPCDTIRILAAVYADHPDYRDEWRPS